MYDISDKTAPSLEGSVPFHQYGGGVSVYMTAIDVEGSYAYVGGSGFEIYNFGAPGADTTPPLVTVDPTNDGTWTSNSSISVNVQASDPESGIASVTMNGQNCPVMAMPGNYRCANVPLSEGANTLTATATNGEGLTATDSITVNRDNTPPSVNITSPADGTWTGDASPLRLRLHGAAQLRRQHPHRPGHGQRRQFRYRFHHGQS
ncbi:hypothetical protein AMJ57_03435 [Parcubacteria bacterium SG8_24]|nr:MAG: hypothetical protein AMJ57_03435 [Parcubacteria bacterium SG8_24]